jgi:hypothetical protein
MNPPLLAAARANARRDAAIVRALVHQLGPVSESTLAMLAEMPADRVSAALDASGCRETPTGWVDAPVAVVRPARQWWRC